MYHHQKYEPYSLAIDFPARTWPSKTITTAPLWCSVDLRDGNQALPIPMSVEKKIVFFKELVRLGFKEIEVGFPAASETEFIFIRRLIEENMIPQDVKIQVLTQARDHLIERTFEAIEGAPHAIIHVYNSTSVAQRKFVFNKNKEEIKQIALTGAALVGKLAQQCSTPISFEYSPESFTGTEIEYSLEVCEAVYDCLKPSTKHKIIFNLPATVEMITPNVYADQIEWFATHFKKRDDILISLHTHNDRGTGVAATELGLLAGADRVEGTLFGNGERTGNVDLVTLALNLYSQGIDPQLNFENIDKVADIYKLATGLPIDPRCPYVGEFVYTAFSGSHQDAIKKGLEAYANESGEKKWSVPYLPLDPSDLNRTYETVIRINSQSGKGGVAYILGQHFGYDLPKTMYAHVAENIQVVSDVRGVELQPEEILDIFVAKYIDNTGELELLGYHLDDNYDKTNERGVALDVTFKYKNERIYLEKKGTGAMLELFFNALVEYFGLKDIVLIDYKEHSLEQGAQARSVAYVGLQSKDARVQWGVAVDVNITTSSIKALTLAIAKILG